ncbi:MAG: class I SAM-dependent methyltransferase [Pirellulaceae bacterium]
MGEPIPSQVAVEELPAETIVPDHWTATPAALDAAQALDIGVSRRGFRILEIGAGAAVFSGAFSHRDPTCHVTVIDNAVGLEKARDTAVGIEAIERFEFVEGDYRSPKFESDSYDMVIVASLLQRFTEAEARVWLKHLVTALKPGGDFVILDWYHGQEKGATAMAFRELEMTLRLAHARVHSPPAIRTWMLDAGLENIQFAFLPSPPHIWGLLVGQRA